MTNLGVYTYAGREHAVASTKTFVSQVTVLALIAAWFSQHRLEQQVDETLEKQLSISSNPSSSHHIRRPSENVDQQRRSNLVQALHRLPTYCGVTLHNVQEDCKKIAEKIKKCRTYFCFRKRICEANC